MSNRFGRKTWGLENRIEISGEITHAKLTRLTKEMKKT